MEAVRCQRDSLSRPMPRFGPVTLVFSSAERQGFPHSRRGTLCLFKRETGHTMSENQDRVSQFVEEAIAITQQLATITGRLSAPERPAIIRNSQNVYGDLQRRRAALVLAPMSEWAIDLLLDGIKTRLGILNESSALSNRTSDENPVYGTVDRCARQKPPASR